MGGAAMCLAFNAREATKDIDAVFAPKMIIYDAAKRIAKKYGLSENWMNNGVKGFLTPGIKFEALISFSHLNVLVAKPEYILAMKCLASRTEIDIDDIKFNPIVGNEKEGRGIINFRKCLSWQIDRTQSDVCS